LADAFRLRQGSIVWISNVPDPQGRNPKPQPRALVIISATADIQPGSSIIGVAVTSTFREPVNDPAMVPMRWNAQGNIETGFRRKCFAKVDWALTIPIKSGHHGPEFDGEHHGTFVRNRELEKILLTMRKLSES